MVSKRICWIVLGILLVTLFLLPIKVHSNGDTNPTAGGLIQVEYGTHLFHVPLTRFVTDRRGILFSYGARTNHFYVRLFYDHSSLHQFSMVDGVRESFPLQDVPRTTRLFAEDPSTGEVLLWDDSVGQVYVLTQDGDITRLDQSFTHRNQYGHASWINTDGSIFAFGGYGLFTSKSIVTYFTRSNRSWSLLHIADMETAPPPQSEALAISDLQRNQVYIVATKDPLHATSLTPGSMDNQGVWRLLLDANRYEFVGDLPFSRIHSNYSQSMHPSGAFFLMGISVPGSNSHDLIAYFPESGRSIQFSDLGIRTHVTDGIFSVFWSDVDDAFYFVHSKWLVAADEYSVTLNRITIPDPEAFVQAYGLPEDTIPLVRYLFIGALFVFAIVVQWMRKRDSKDEESMSADDVDQLVDTPPAQNVSISDDDDNLESGFLEKGGYDETPFPIEDGYVCRVVIPEGHSCAYLYTSKGGEIEINTPNEIKLLKLLVAHHNENPTRYTTSDEIDAVLIPDHPSPDYIRRIRNLTINRLTEILDESGEQGLLLRRKVKMDKRKVEYRLSDRVQT